MSVVGSIIELRNPDDESRRNPETSAIPLLPSIERKPRRIAGKPTMALVF
jgi:hypothetical protein